MRPGLVIGIGSILSAFGIGWIHEAFTGDPSIKELVMRGVVYAALIAFLITLRLGLPGQIRAMRIRRALAKP